MNPMRRIILVTLSIITTASYVTSRDPVKSDEHTNANGKQVNQSTKTVGTFSQTFAQKVRSYDTETINGTFVYNLEYVRETLREALSPEEAKEFFTQMEQKNKHRK